jgi:hypothetical protein
MVMRETNVARKMISSPGELPIPNADVFAWQDDHRPSLKDGRQRR